MPSPSYAPRPRTGWKGVLNDWFVDGRLNGRHTRRAVREAIRHLPADLAFSTEFGDLTAYARRVC